MRVQDRGVSMVSRETKHDVVAAELQRIAKANRDVLTPEFVLRNARDEKSPIHSQFCWDDSVAGERFRLLQAQNLIRMVRVVISNHDQDSGVKTRAWLNVSVTPAPPTNGDTKRLSERQPTSGYVPVQTALTVPEYKSQVMADAFRELISFRNKYQMLKELSVVFDAIDKLALDVG